MAPWNRRFPFWKPIIFKVPCSTWGYIVHQWYQSLPATSSPPWGWPFWWRVEVKRRPTRCLGVEGFKGKLTLLVWSYGCFLKWWVSPTTMGFPTKNDQHLGCFGGPTILGNTHIWRIRYVTYMTIMFLHLSWCFLCSLPTFHTNVYQQCSWGTWNCFMRCSMLGWQC